MPSQPIQTSRRNAKYLFIFFLLPLFYIPCFISNEVLIQATTEDAVIENIGALFFLMTALSFFLIALWPNRFLIENLKDLKKGRMYFFFFGALFFFAFGEEISWGQRIFNFDTPASMEAINAQGEFNIHNIKVFHGRGEDGEEKTGLASMFTLNRIFYMAFFTYLFIIPLFAMLNASFKAFLERLGLPIPLIIFGILFCVNWLFANSLIALLTDLKTHGIVEIKETVFAFVLFICALSWMKLKGVNN